MSNERSELVYFRPVGREYRIFRSGFAVATVFATMATDKRFDDDVRRIVAALNSCAGVPTDELERRCAAILEAK